jgi:hypothetical protein
MATAMDTLTDFLTEARSAWARGDWRASRAAYVRVDGIGPMSLDDLDAFATATWRLGDGQEAARLTERVYDRLARTDPSAAARKAVDVALVWRGRGHHAMVRTWTERARVLLVRDDGAVAGYLTYLDAASATDGSVPADAAKVLRDNATRSDDPALAVLADVIAGLAALTGARAHEGMRLLDTALLPVIDERVPLEWAGDVYRTVLGPAARFADDAHIAAWTRSRRSWCAATGIPTEVVTVR